MTATGQPQNINYTSTNVGGGPAAEYAAYIGREQAIWKNIVERASIKPD